MLAEFPSLLRKAALFLIIGVTAGSISLAVSGPIPYILTLGIGCTSLFLAAVFYLIYFARALSNKETQ